MTTRFRIEAVRLATTNGEVAYSFPSSLTVLAGGVGVGKSTLFELIKFACGGNALIADVAEKHVIDVSVDLTVGDERLGLVRAVHPDARGVVRVTDLVTGERQRDHRVDSGEPSLSDLLLTSLGLATDLRATSKSARATRPGNRITFNDIFTFLYVPQAEISRDIAHSKENVREPKRRAVFELLFGFTDATALEKRSEAATLRSKLQELQSRSAAIQSFLIDSGTTTQMDAMLRLQQAEQAESAATSELAGLREALEPVADTKTRTLRDLLTEAERGLAQARANEARLQQQLIDYEREAKALEQDIGRLDRLQAAGARLADIEFRACPRCLQDVTARHVESHLCRLCLQDDPVARSGVSPLVGFEREQLSGQLAEMQSQVTIAEHELTQNDLAVRHRAQLITDLSTQIDERTRTRIAPRLRAYEDATSELATARATQDQVEQVLRQWDLAEDYLEEAASVERRVARLTADAETAEQSLQQRKSEVLGELNAEFEDTIRSIGVPGIENVEIDPTTYLPMLNGKKFTEFNPAGGGINTATQVAYWITLLTVALRRRDTHYPAFMLLDSPRTSLNNERQMAKALYSRIERQTGLDDKRLQIIIADNELPDDYRQQAVQIVFDYQRPTVATIRHPGPAKVTTLGTDESAKSPS